MTSQEISGLIATDIRGWTKIDEIAYQDSAGNIYYLPNYPDSIAHALDLAMAEQISLTPMPDSTWRATSLGDTEIFAVNTSAGMAICLAVLKQSGLDV